MPPIDQNTALLIGGLAVVVFIFFALRDTGRRKYQGNKRDDSSQQLMAPSGCGCGCQSTQYVDAVRCARPNSQPTAIYGLSCDPNDPTAPYAGDVQAFVDVMSEQSEQRRRKIVARDFRAAFDDPDDPPKKGSK